MDILLSHDRTLTDRAYRAAIIASRLGKFQFYFQLQMNRSLSQVMINVWKYYLITE